LSGGGGSKNSLYEKFRRLLRDDGAGVPVQAKASTQGTGTQMQTAHERRQEQLRLAERGAWISIGVYLVLAALKMFVGLRAGSKALFADGLNNSTDILASVAVLIGLRIARRPADEDHRYGHYRAETVATFVAAIIMAVVGFDVLFDAVRSLFTPLHAVPSAISLWVALFSAGVMLASSIYNRRLGQRIQSKAVLAAAADNRSDAMVSIGAFAGILGAQFGLYWLDPVAAIVVGLIILKTAYEIFRESAHALTDGYEEGKLKEIEDLVLGVQDVQEIVDLKARTYGSSVYVDVVIGVDQDMTVREGHEITDDIERLLCSHENIDHVHIHVEPVQHGSARKSPEA
jgi:cation diffusion facilitator family transporter